MCGFVEDLENSSLLASQISVRGCEGGSFGLVFPACCSIEGAFLRKTFRGDELVEFSDFGGLSEGDDICGGCNSILEVDEEGVVRGKADAPGTGDREPPVGRPSPLGADITGLSLASSPSEVLEPLLLLMFKGAILGVCALGVVEPLLDVVGILGNREDEVDVGAESVPAWLGLRDDMM